MKPEVILKKTLKDKLDYISSNYDYEIGGWLIGEIKKGKIILEDLLISKQTVSVGEVSVKPENLVELRKEYGNLCKKILGKFHSHHSMGVFWSITDEECINSFAKPRNLTVWIVSSKGKHKIRIEMRKPIFLSLDDVNFSVELDKKIIKELDKEIKEKVKVNTFSSSLMDFDGIGNFYQNWNKKEKSTENILKEEINNKIKFSPSDNTVTIKDLEYYEADHLAEDYNYLKPDAYLVGDKAIIIFRFSSKSQAIDFIKEVKKDIKEWEEEIPSEQGGLNYYE